MSPSILIEARGFARPWAIGALAQWEVPGALSEPCKADTVSCAPQKDFTVREELQQQDVERWLGFITFLCEVFGTMRSSTGEPFRVLVCPIYTCLREVRDMATPPGRPRPPARASHAPGRN